MTTGTADIELLPPISQTLSAESGSGSLGRKSQTASAKSAIAGRTAAFDEVTCGAVKGQDERPFGAPLTAPQVTTGSIQHGTELA
jgi:hypothetical protein